MDKRKWIAGSATIEMAYIIPMFLGFFVLIMTCIFYFHDKCVLYAAAYETSVVGAQKERLEKTYSEEELEAYFMERTEKALIFFPMVEVSVDKNLEYVTVEADAQKNEWEIHAKARSMIMRTEELIYMKGILNKEGENGEKEGEN